jgi:hypothetical protein
VLVEGEVEKFNNVSIVFKGASNIAASEQR